jgi:hypothetical protein
MSMQSSQVLFTLERYDRIKRVPKVRDGDGTIATVDQYGKWAWYKKGQHPGFTDIYAVLACFFEEMRGPDRKTYTVVSSAPVERGHFPSKSVKRISTENGYPYRVQWPIGCRSDQIIPSRVYQGEDKGKGPGHGGAGGYGGTGGYGGASMPGPSSHSYQNY